MAATEITRRDLETSVGPLPGTSIVVCTDANFSPTFSPTSVIQPDPPHLPSAIWLNYAAAGPVWACRGGLPCRRSWVRVPSSASEPAA